MCLENNEIEKDTSEHIFDQLKNLHNERTEVGHECWFIFSIFCAANAVLLDALFQSGDHHFLWIKWIAIPIAGLILSITWFILQLRINNVMRFYEDMVNKLEGKFFSEDYQSGRKNPSSKNFNKYKGFGAKPLMEVIPLLGIVTWGIMLCFGQFVFGIFGVIFGLGIAAICWILSNCPREKINSD